MTTLRTAISSNILHNDLGVRNSAREAQLKMKDVESTETLCENHLTIVDRLSCETDFKNFLSFRATEQKVSQVKEVKM